MGNSQRLSVPKGSAASPDRTQADRSAGFRQAGWSRGAVARRCRRGSLPHEHTSSRAHHPRAQLAVIAYDCCRGWFARDPAGLGQGWAGLFGVGAGGWVVAGVGRRVVRDAHRPDRRLRKSLWRLPCCPQPRISVWWKPLTRVVSRVLFGFCFVGFGFCLEFFVLLVLGFGPRAC